MGSLSFDRSKKKIQVWKKAILHFSLCFVMGFFTGFAPTSTTSFFFSSSSPAHLHSYLPVPNLGISAQPESLLNLSNETSESGISNRSLMSEISNSDSEEDDDDSDDDEETPSPVVVEDSEVVSLPSPRRLLIIITPTRSGDLLQDAFLRRLGHTLRLVPAPLLWVVVGAHGDALETAGTLRKTGIMYRHLTFKENFTDAGAEADHQRNLALSHIEHHRLAGIVHFAAASNIYDLQFFEEIRDIEVFGTWPVAMLSTNRKRVLVEGPICSSSQVLGWQSKDISNGSTTYISTTMGNSNAEMNNAATDADGAPVKINVSGFAFNSSILWDPERWGRPTSFPDTSQDSFKFVQQVVLEDETKLRGIPPDCSRVMLWHLYIPRTLSFYQSRDSR